MLISRRRSSILLGLFFSAVIAVSPSGCGDEPLTRGRFCSRYGTAFCDRAVACDLLAAGERSTCLSDFQDGCCEDDGACAEKPDPGEEDDAEQFLASCATAFKTFSCTALAATNVPVECTVDALSLRSSLEAPAPKPASFDAHTAGAGARARF